MTPPTGFALRSPAAPGRCSGTKSAADLPITPSRGAVGPPPGVHCRLPPAADGSTSSPTGATYPMILPIGAPMSDGDAGFPLNPGGGTSMLIAGGAPDDGPLANTAGATCGAIPADAVTEEKCPDPPAPPLAPAARCGSGVQSSLELTGSYAMGMV